MWFNQSKYFILLEQIYNSNQVYSNGGLFHFSAHAGLAVFWHSCCRAWNIQNFCIEAWLRSLSTKSHVYLFKLSVPHAAAQPNICTAFTDIFLHLCFAFSFFFLFHLNSATNVQNKTDRERGDEKKCDVKVQMGCGFSVFYA